MSAIPADDLAAIEKFCADRVPAEMRDRIRIEHRTRGKTVTIFECQPGWVDQDSARIKYDETTQGWTLYWFDRHSKAHIYDFLDPHQPIERILEEIERDPTCIFWG